MKLNQLLKQITPLPWSVSNDTAEVNYVQSNCGMVVKPPGRPADADNETVANSIYLAHAANQLPKLVEALRDARKHIAVDYPQGKADYDEAGRILAATENIDPIPHS